jgi:hypothetical protein
MEATLFTGWIYDFLKPHAGALRVGHPLRLRAITAAKKKSDRLDAQTLADLLRCNLFPECYMAPAELREVRRVLTQLGFFVAGQDKTIKVAVPSTHARAIGTMYFQQRDMS